MKIATPRAASFCVTGALAGVFVLFSLYPSSASAHTTASISEEPLTATVTITRAKSFTTDCLFAGNQDMYAKIWLNDQLLRTDTQGNGSDDIHPTNWSFTVPLDPAVEEIPLRLELWEEDAGTCGGDDEFDILSGAGTALDLMINIRTCVVRG